MKRVIVYSLLLIAGMGLSQMGVAGAWTEVIAALTMILLAYIMIEVGMEFDIDKSHLRQYGADALIAMGAAAIPWLFAAGYFWWIFNLGIKESLLVGRFASPTSAGILFTMLAAAGLAATWVYKKARVLAIFDDLDTVILMIPLKMLLVGFEPKLLILIIVILALLGVAYFCIHWLRISTNSSWIAVYAVVVWGVCFAFDYVTELHLEVLLPAFALGCLIKSDHLHGSAEYRAEDIPTAHHVSAWERVLDQGMKGAFMFLAGMALPPIQLGAMDLGVAVIHVILITILSNLGKCVPLPAYRDEVSIRQRLALSVGMFPRGEVGIGVLLVSLAVFRQQGLLNAPGVQESMALAALSLALNLALTGLFILFVIRLLKRPG
jgi:Kef-type K+ transport system membrane component KefB